MIQRFYTNRSYVRSRLVLATLLLTGAATLLAADEVPTLKVGYIFTTHHTPLMVAAAKGAEFKDGRVYLNPVIPKEKYELMADGKKIANLDLVVNKSGSETATLFAQKHIDVAMASVTAIMAGADKGTPVKVVAPLQTEGMALVMPKDSPVTGWDGLLAFIKDSKKPVKIGYHSPTSAPKIVLESALKAAGLRVTEDPNDMSANVLLVDLKDTPNMIPALTSKQVEGIVGPSPFPEVAVTRGAGKIVMDLRDLPPSGYWHDFPCCVTAARDEVITKHPEAVGAFVKLVTRTNEWCNQNKAAAGTLAAEWIGVPAEVGKASSLVFLPKFTDGWMRGAGAYMEILNSMGNFTGKLKDKKLDEVKATLFDLRFID